MINNSLPNQPDELNIQLNLANDYQLKGKLDLAIGTYQKILLQEQNCIIAYLALGTLLAGQGRFTEVISLYEKAIGLMPIQPEFHKSLINALVAKEGLEPAFKYYELNRADTKEIEIQPQDILCYAVIRNELTRLPYLLSYYRQKGVSKFLIIDNNSTDGSLNYLLEQPDVYTWHSTYSYNKANLGTSWIELLLRKYGIGHWCLIVDADEILYYPDCEKRSIVHLCQELSQKQKTVFNVVLVDMYSDKAIKDTHYTSGEDFLDVCPYFDRDFYHEKKENWGTYRNQTCYWGGVRERVFGSHCLLSKVALVKYNIDFIVAGGQHWTNRPKHEIAESSGCLLHFKFFSNFYSYVEQEVKRKEHWSGAREYVEYAQGLRSNDNIKLYDEKYSLKLENSQQLVDLGIMQVEKTSSAQVVVEFPKIYPVAAHISRPFWSVMMIADQQVDYLEQALKNVLQQASSVEEMQIEVVNNAADESTLAKIRDVVEAVGDKKINLYQHSENISKSQIFNICIQRAKGHWVHIFHANHVVQPGFYRQLQDGIEKDESVGAAFCRHIHVNTNGNVCKISPLERETPGVIADWLERITLTSRLEFPSVVVRRDVYEKLGGFYQEIDSAFDWEMWKRIAAYYPVWYEPQPLVYLRENFRDERRVADSLKAIEISQVYLQSEIGHKLTNKARENCALYAFYCAQQQLQQGDYPRAIALLREGLKCSQSAQIKQALILLLLQTESIIDKGATS